MSSSDSTRSKPLAVSLLVALTVGSCLSGCTGVPQQKVVYIQWQALLIYHPLWEAQRVGQLPQPSGDTSAHLLPSRFLLPETAVHPLQTPEAERRRQRLAQTSVQKQQALSARLQQMEARLLQEEMVQLQAEQQAEVERLRQELLQQVEQETEDALRQHHLPQADTEIKRRILQRLVRIRPDQRDALNARLQEVEAEQAHLSETLRQRLVRIEEETRRRIREQEQSVQREYERRREELRERSAKRLLAEQLRASVQIRAFADTGKPVVFPQVILRVPEHVRRNEPPSPAPAVSPQHIRSLIEQDVRLWAEAICRRHRWKPVWQPRAGIPDITEQIAQEMRGDAR